MSVHLPITHVIITARQSLLARFLPPSSLVFRAVKIQCGRDDHLDVFACLERVEFAVDVEGKRGVRAGRGAHHTRNAVVGLIKHGGDFEGFFVESRVV